MHSVITLQHVYGNRRIAFVPGAGGRIALPQSCGEAVPVPACAEQADSTIGGQGRRGFVRSNPPQGRTDGNRQGVASTRDKTHLRRSLRDEPDASGRNTLPV